MATNKNTAANVRKLVKKLAPLWVAGGHVKWDSGFGGQFANSLKY